jgi:hypothetical protein
MRATTFGLRVALAVGVQQLARHGFDLVALGRLAGPSGGANGLDQVNILIPAKLAGAGNVNVQLTVEGKAANPVQITIQ